MVCCHLSVVPCSEGETQALGSRSKRFGASSKALSSSFRKVCSEQLGVSLGKRVRFGVSATRWRRRAAFPTGLTCPGNSYSTELMRRVRRFQIAQNKCLVIKYAKDTRYSSSFSTHDRSVVPPPSCGNPCGAYCQMYQGGGLCQNWRRDGLLQASNGQEQVLRILNDLSPDGHCARRTWVPLG